LGKVTDVTGHDGKAGKEGNGSNTQVLTTDADTLGTQLAKHGVSCFMKSENIPLAELGDHLDESNVPLRCLGWNMTIFADISKPPSQLFLNGYRGREKLRAGCAIHFGSEDRVRVLVMRDRVGVEDEHCFASSSLRIIASMASLARR
jgi:hypothetical protein